MGGRSPCCDKSKVKRGPWSPAEDVRLVSFIQKHGHPNWRSLPRQAGLLRCGKSCRLRWINYLRPDVKRGNFTPEEEHSIIQLHATFGNKWSKIASHLPGRTDNEIKNVWNTHLKKRLLPMNITNNFNANTPSSSFVSSISNELPRATELTTGATLVEDIVDQPSTPSSIISCNISPQDHITSWDTPLCNDDQEIKNNLQVSLEYEVEFWNMLEPQAITDHDMLEVENWARSLEEELGLVGPTASQQNDDQCMTVGLQEQQPVSDVRCKIIDEISPFWPTSPMNFGYSG